MALPIILESLDAYEGHVGVAFSLWERRVLCRVDDAVVSLLNGRVAERDKPAKDDKPAAISMTDSQGVKSFMLGLAATKKKGVKNG